MSSRAAETFNSIPLITCSLIVLNVTIHLYNFLFTIQVNNYAISSIYVVAFNQWYRILTSAFIHGGFFHLLMNMMSLYQLGIYYHIKLLICLFIALLKRCIN